MARMGTRERASMSERLVVLFQSLGASPFRITSPIDRSYNCFAWAASSSAKCPFRRAHESVLSRTPLGLAEKLTDRRLAKKTHTVTTRSCLLYSRNEHFAFLGVG